MLRVAELARVRDLWHGPKSGDFGYEKTPAAAALDQHGQTSNMRQKKIFDFAPFGRERILTIRTQTV
jgi:hypothetical protein